MSENDIALQIAADFQENVGLISIFILVSTVSLFVYLIVTLNRATRQLALSDLLVKREQLSRRPATEGGYKPNPVIRDKLDKKRVRHTSRPKKRK